MERVTKKQSSEAREFAKEVLNFLHNELSDKYAFAERLVGSAQWNTILKDSKGFWDIDYQLLLTSNSEEYLKNEDGSYTRAPIVDTSKLNTEGEKRPISFQIFGSDEETMGYAANKISEIADIIDINMGCPAPKVVKNGDGSKLLLDLEKAKMIIRAVIKNSKVPVTLKIRTGWDKEHIVATEIAKIAENEGISAITVHGRTRSEYYTGKANFDIIKQVKETVKIPVIGNGDVIDEKSALNMFEYTGVDGIMIGRGSFGNPWIFKQILTYLETGKILEKPSNEEKLKIIKKQK